MKRVQQEPWRALGETSRVTSCFQGLESGRGGVQGEMVPPHGQTPACWNSPCHLYCGPWSPPTHTFSSHRARKGHRKHDHTSTASSRGPGRQGPQSSRAKELELKCPLGPGREGKSEAGREGTLGNGEACGQLGRVCCS